MREPRSFKIFRAVVARVGLILTYLTFSLPFSIWMLASYLDGIPRELDEAARVDGASALGALFRVVLPAARPGVIAVAVYSFMTSWGEILFASQMTNDSTRRCPWACRTTRRRSTSIGTRSWRHPSSSVCPS